MLTELGFPTDSIEAVKGLYTGATTAFLTPEGPTKQMIINRGTLQGDAISPFLFLCFLEPLLRWLDSDTSQHYAMGTSDITVGPLAYADDMALWRTTRNS